MDEFSLFPICMGAVEETQMSLHLLVRRVAARLLCIARAGEWPRANAVWQTALTVHARDTIPRREGNRAHRFVPPGASKARVAVPAGLTVSRKS
jgi:hypothetical protein